MQLLCGSVKPPTEGRFSSTLPKMHAPFMLCKINLLEIDYIKCKTYITGKWRTSF
jgi:hypothetical protein